VAFSFNCTQTKYTWKQARLLAVNCAIFLPFCNKMNCKGFFLIHPYQVLCYTHIILYFCMYITMFVFRWHSKLLCISAIFILLSLHRHFVVMAKEHRKHITQVPTKGNVYSSVYRSDLCGFNWKHAPRIAFCYWCCLAQRHLLDHYKPLQQRFRNQMYLPVASVTTKAMF
jgi:hypothetical protein